MKAIIRIILVLLFASNLPVFAQQAFDSSRFFIDETILPVTISTDLGNLLSGKIKSDSQDARFSLKSPDSSMISEVIQISVRGKMRRKICDVPPIRLDFTTPTSPILHSLNKVKLVNACSDNSVRDQWLLKEFLIYKMYNFLTDKSFRVRLLNITFEDTKGKKKPIIQYGFMLEDVDAMAKRNKCKELEEVKISAESTERAQMTTVALFEYMIGNTDWSVPNNHNIKLILPKKDSTAAPFPVPYDFDYSGMVNTDYAVPDEMMGTESVVERVYRGFPRTMEELQVSIQVFNKQKDNIYSLINNFELLNKNEKKEMIRYLDDYYSIINNTNKVQTIFIDNARSN